MTAKITNRAAAKHVPMIIAIRHERIHRYAAKLASAASRASRSTGEPPMILSKSWLSTSSSACSTRLPRMGAVRTSFPWLPPRTLPPLPSSASSSQLLSRWARPPRAAPILARPAVVYPGSPQQVCTPPVVGCARARGLPFLARSQSAINALLAGWLSGGYSF